MLFLFFTFFRFSFSTWTDFYNVLPEPKIKVAINKHVPLPPHEKNYYISDSFIYNLDEPHNGAFIDFKSGIEANTYILFEKTTIANCHSHGSFGGAIYCSLKNGACSFFKVCGYNCISVQNGLFLHVTESEFNSNPSFLNDTTICNCNLQKGVGTVRYYGGTLKFQGTNFSQNTCKNRCSVDFYAGPAPSAEDLTVFSMQFSSLISNTADSFSDIFIIGNTNQKTIVFKSINYVKNIQNKNPTTDHGTGLISFCYDATFSDSLFTKNTCSYLLDFYNMQYMKTTKSTFSNCVVDSDMQFAGKLIEKQKIPGTSFVNEFTVLNTEQCPAEGLGIQIEEGQNSNSDCITCPYMFYKKKSLFDNLFDIINLN